MKDPKSRNMRVNEMIKEVKKYYNSHKMQVLCITLVILCFILFIAIFAENNRLKKKQKEQEPDVIATLQPETTTQNENETSVTEKTTKKAETTPDAIFKNAVFIGDSRTEGFYFYSDITKYCENFLVHKGLTVSDFGSKKFAGKKENQTVYEALKGKKYDKVFLMQGLNELGWPSSEQFVASYQKVIEKIRKLLPNATIYVQEIIEVSKKKSENDQYFTKARVDEWNQKVKGLCDGKKIVWIPLNDKLTDKNGYLISAASTDGIHLKKEYCQIWLQELIDFFQEKNK